MRERLPGTAGHVAAAKFSRELVEVFARFVTAFSQGELERRPVALRLRHFPSENADQLAHFGAGRVPLLLRRQPVVNIFSRPAILDYAGALQLGEVTRNPGLSHPENLLKLGDGKLVFL